MGMSISFKKSSTSSSIKHNNRDFQEKDWDNEFHDHIDRERTFENVTLVQEDIHDKYDELFGSAVDEYNEKQTRDDRKIKDYYSKVRNDKRLEPQREFIVQVGDKTDFEGDKKMENWQTANEVLTDYAQTFEQRNPNLKVYNAVIHNDEASPHLHLNVVPVATGYQRGVQVQPSFNKALKQQGITADKDNGRVLWNNFRSQEVSYVEKNLLERGIEREIRGKNLIKDVHEYKKVVKELRSKAFEEFHEGFIKEKEEHLSEVEKSKLELEKVQKDIKERGRELKGLDEKIDTSLDNLDKIDKVIDKKTKVFVEQIDKIQKANQDIENYKFTLQKIGFVANQIPEIDPQTTDIEALYHATGKYMPNTFGTNKEQKARDIAKLMNQAKMGEQVPKLLQENHSLRVNRDDEIKKQVEKATTPLSDKIQKQNQKIERQEKEISKKDRVISSLSSALNDFKHQIKGKYKDFLQHLGIAMKENNVQEIPKEIVPNPRDYQFYTDKNKVKELNDERNAISKGFNMSKHDKQDFKEKTIGQKAPEPKAPSRDIGMGR